MRGTVSRDRMHHNAELPRGYLFCNDTEKVNSYDAFNCLCIFLLQLSLAILGNWRSYVHLLRRGAFVK